MVIQNLLSNAVKFTREGHVGLAAAALAEGKVAIRVSDSGPGIPAENLEDIFDLFHQLRPTDVTAKGWGLGLALARRFARMMGGDITVESTVGRGTTFTLMLPTTAARALRAEDFAAI
ncbi:MAG: ATP-binding protein [Candidatus Binatia bacterium]